MKIVIKAAEWITDGGYPFLLLTLADGQKATINTEQRRLAEDGIVFFGGELLGSEEVSVQIPGAPRGYIWSGATDDEQVVRLAKKFLDAAGDGTFEPKTVRL